MIILDTNVLSAVMRHTPDQNVIAWLDRQPRTSVWTSSVTVLEVRFGLQVLPSGKRRSALVRAFDEVLDAIGHRVASFDVAAAQQAGDLMASRQRLGRPGDLRDTMIAGIALARRATLATRNTAHFNDISVPVVNPWLA
jgi:predicted nucleic acid-binding protein